MLIDLLGILIITINFILSMFFIDNEEVDLKDKKIVFAILILFILNSLPYFGNMLELKPFVSIISLTIVSIVVLKNKIPNAIFKVIIVYMYSILFELLYILLLAINFNIYSFYKLNDIIISIMDNSIYSFIYNIVFAISCMWVMSSKFLINIYKRIIDSYLRIDKKKLLYYVIMVFFALFFIYIVLLFSNNVFLIISVFICLIFIISIIIYNNLKVRFEYEEAKEKYNSTQKSLLEYEDMIDKYRVNNHENKNQLLTIQNMIKVKDNKVNDYIDNLVGNVYMTNEKIMMDISVIPAGGLRATIHTKLNTMDNMKIKYILNIDRKLRTIDFESINLNLNLKICKIVSIFIDNAIDEVATHDKNKLVNIEMYIDNGNLIFEVSNRFIKKFDVNKIYDKKYTTKDTGHGYGLSLAKELIDSDKQLQNYNRIEDNIFTQVLEIGLKETKKV